MGGLLRIGEVFRYTREKDPSVPIIDGYRNFHHATDSPGRPRVLLESGINVIAKTRGSDGLRRPALLIRSSPWKAGTRETPWHDVFDLDNGRVRYFGDHKAGLTVPTGSTRGNAALLEAFAEHNASTVAERAQAVPLLLFKAVSRNKTPKGYVEFCGAAVIEHAEQVVQEAEGDRSTFTNYVYDLAVLDLSAEDDRVDWAWIDARGTPSMLAAGALANAPRSWQQWVEHGHVVLPDVRRQTTRAGSVNLPGRRVAVDAIETPGLFPAPRQPDTAAQDRLTTVGAVELTADLLLGRLGNLSVHRRNGRASRHKPLTLLWA
ncbi:hypothetical protein [Actinacidiphila glaucinigra]|uniref:hypothetical protein n=1 Tax=Actinacidiphila glaucinigra TaxID=235986 RepID=UPI003D8AE824